MKSVIIPQLAPQIKEVIDKSQWVLLHCHPSPDPDSVGSSLAMYHALTGMGKEVTVIGGDSPKPENLSVLPGWAEIVAKPFGEIDLSQFDLFIILDSGAPVMVTRLQEVVFPDHLKTIVIDHHATNSGYGQINLIEPDYPAAAQVLAELFLEWQIKITPEMAVCLLMGMYYDTGGFRFRTTTSRTFEIAAKLVEIYPDFTAVISAISDQLEPEQLYFKAMAFEHIELFGHDQVAIISLPYQLLKQHEIKEENIKNQGLPNTLITVKGWNIGISIIEREEGFNRISFRVKERSGFDVSKIATLLGGGGHKPAAGALIQGTNEEAKQKVVEAIYTVYPELR